ncbi:MAG TPA: serine/threonine-protein kinase, partial [Nitrososphaera sp.]|nr:serine/threonine-protein kinase [Nitrososphaera sp.]
KPSNVILIDSGTDGWTAKLCDFGLAKFDFDEQQLTRADAIVGTPAYLSPEAALGRTVDARSDIYSLGCLMFETLTGQPPFSGATEVEVLMARVQQKAPSLQKRSGKRFSDELERVLEMCLQTEPEKRFQSIAELEQSLIALTDLDGNKKDDTVHGTAEPAKHLVAPLLVTEEKAPAAQASGWLIVAVLLMLSVGAAFLMFRFLADDAEQSKQTQKKSALFFDGETSEADQHVRIEHRDGVEWIRLHGFWTDSHLSRVPDAEYIATSKDAFREDGFKYLLKKPVAIKGLDLSLDRVSEQNFSYIGQMHKLRILRMEATIGLTLNDLKSISNCRDLEIISLRDTEITDEFISALAGLPKLR